MSYYSSPVQKPFVAKAVSGISRVAVFALLTVFAVALLIFALLDVGSTRTVYERAVSPDGWHEARVQFDDAGALSSFSRLVFVKHRWNYSDEPLLSCRAFWGDGENRVHVRWLNSNTLLIDHGFPQQDVQAISGSCGPIRILVRGQGHTDISLTKSATPDLASKAD